jgi:hypothetical protein
MMMMTMMHRSRRGVVLSALLLSLVALLGLGTAAVRGSELDLSLMANEDIEAFAEQFLQGGGRSPQAFEGSLHIFGEVTSLSGLENLQRITGDFSIVDSSLSTLQGLEQLTSVGGSLKLAYNPLLSTVAALSQLEEVGGSLEITENAALENLMGLEQLQEVRGDLVLEDNENMTLASLADVSQLQQVKDLIISWGDLMLLKSASVRGEEEDLNSYITIFNNDQQQMVMDKLSGPADFGSYFGPEGAALVG